MFCFPTSEKLEHLKTGKGNIASILKIFTLLFSIILQSLLHFSRSIAIIKNFIDQIPKG